VEILKGYEKDVEPQRVYPDNKGNIIIEIKELEPVEIHLDNSYPSSFYSGYRVVNHQLRPLPIGSTLDMEKGIFYWYPGPGFLGKHRLLFIIKGKNGTFKKNIIIRIRPLGKGPKG
jgi:hypothetical protein